MQGTDLAIEGRIAGAMHQALARYPALCDGAVGDDPTAEQPTPDIPGTADTPGTAPSIVHVQVHGLWVCVSRLVSRVSCCREQLAWSAGWVLRRFDATAARPIGIEDRRHHCGRTPDAVDVTDRFQPGEESLEQFCARIAAELSEAFGAAAARTRAGYRGAAVAVDRRKAMPAMARRDFHLRTLDL